MKRLIIIAVVISGIIMTSCMSPEWQACVEVCKKMEISEADTLDVIERRHYSEMEYSYGMKYNGKMGWRWRQESMTDVVLSNGDSTTFDFHTECMKVIKKPRYMPQIQEDKTYKPKFVEWSYRTLK